MQTIIREFKINNIILLIMRPQFHRFFYCYFSYFTFLEEVSVSGVHLEDCLVPCKTTTYHVTEVTVAKEHHWNEFKGIFIWFEEEVKITKSTFNFDYEKMYSTIGGIMGTSRSFVWLIILLISTIGIRFARVHFIL